MATEKNESVDHVTQPVLVHELKFSYEFFVFEGEKVFEFAWLRK